MTRRVDLRRLVAEGGGTFFLVSIGPGAVMVDAYTGGAIGHTDGVPAMATGAHAGSASVVLL